MKRIPLTKGKFALVDDEDFEFLMQWKWCCLKADKDHYYAYRTESFGDSKNGVLMHRFLLNLSDKDIFVDHINGNGLDNRRENIRAVTVSQNNLNRRGDENSTSRFKGVCWDTERKTWIAKIMANRKYKFIGRFQSEMEAALAYNHVALEMHGEFARLNEIYN